MRKPNSTAIIDGLPQHQRDQIEAWLFDDAPTLSYNEAARRLKADCNVSIAPSSLSAWYQRTAQRRMLDRIAASRGTANLVVEKFREHPADMYQVLLDMAGQIAFDEAFQSEKKLDAETIFNFTKLVMAGRKQQLEAEHLALDRRRVALLEKKAEAFDKAKEVMASEMTPEERDAEYRRIFGMGG